MDNTVALASIALAASTVAFLGAMLKWATTKLSADLQSHSESQRMVAEAMDKVAKATQRGADEAAQRNGHLAELVEQGNKMVADLPKTIQKIANETASNIVNQSVQEQHIDKQIVGGKE